MRPDRSRDHGHGDRVDRAGDGVDGHGGRTDRCSGGVDGCSGTVASAGTSRESPGGWSPAALTAAVACAGGGPAPTPSSVTLVVERVEPPRKGGRPGAAPRMFIESDVVTDGSVTRGYGAGDLCGWSRRILRCCRGIPCGAHRRAVFATIHRYRVRYLRSDGRNAPGIDVPHPWDGALTLAGLVRAVETTEFVLVRASAKLDAPLVSAAGRRRRRRHQYAMAHVTFYGRDHGGARIEASGAIDGRVRGLVRCRRRCR